MNMMPLGRHAPVLQSFFPDESVAMRPAEREALQFLLPLSSEYPHIEKWFRSRVVPGLRTGTRTLICVHRQGQLVGVGIGKNEVDERKICTVRVAPSYFGRGIGLRLFDSLLRWLDTDQPHLTVSEPKLPAFERIFERYNFTRTSSHLGLYVPGVAEFSYNDYADGPLNNF
ncbi:GNAT family N-acetyltransferase [Bradyrhizobium sp. 30]|uniref:GNAT family N-acetyltransferase n=1 Tax=Bradyrhizobium sp. 30 TaxID=2782669 RepID=UPI001FF82A27|nr:GNAT family N-acetyltransferase [Bradyrhizobium sp. 30]